jgi:4-amino-4-deoxy-L-arabinose transferase-like glycosyltransferase
LSSIGPVQERPGAAAPVAPEPPRGLLPLLWAASGLLLLVWIGTPPVERAQEARVLETSRQMLGTGWRGWMVPLLNGEPRLKKPPLAYWLTAASFKVFGVSEAAGRVPAVLAGWLTLALTFAAARLLFDTRVALSAAACLFGSYLFFRYTRLAETDPPATLFVTLAVYAILRASLTGRAAWFHVAAAATAGAVMAKGGPAAYPALFLVGWAGITGWWGLLWDFVRCGAPATLLVLALPWFVYVARATPAAAVLGDEVGVVVTGVDHGRPPWAYVPLLLLGPLPWTAVAAAGVVAAAAALRPLRDLRRRPLDPLLALLVWLLAVVLPLLCIGNKQFHYLLPAMPPLMILAGRAVERAASAFPDDPFHPLARRVLGWTFVAAAIAAGLFPVAGYAERRNFNPMDGAMAGLLVAGVALVYLARRWGGVRAAVVAGAGAFAVAAAAGESLWLPTVRASDMRSVAREVADRFGAGPFCYYGPNDSLPLRFYLRSPIPRYETAEALGRAVGQDSSWVVIAQTKSAGRIPAPPPPPGFVAAGEPLCRRDQVFAFYRFAGPPPSSSTTR